MTLVRASVPLFVLLSLGCQSTASGEVAEEESALEAKADDEAKGEAEAETWEARGIIKRIERERGTITIHHEDVPGYMPSMTMPFWVESPAQFEGLAVGDSVEFRFRRGEGGKHVLVSIRKR